MYICTYTTRIAALYRYTYVRTYVAVTQSNTDINCALWLAEFRFITPGPSSPLLLPPQTKVSSESHYAGVVARAQAAAALAKTKQGGGKRAASTLKASPADMLQDSEANLTAVESKETAEGQEYRDSRTYVLLEVTLQKPLIPRRTAAVLAERCVPTNVL